MLRAALLSLALFAPNVGHTLCNGPDFLSQISQEDRTALYTQAAQTRYGNGLFYRATRDGKTLHILGTIHLPDPRNDAIVEMALPQLDTSTLLLVEATQDDQTAMQVHMAQNPDLMTLPADQSLPDLLGDDTWDAIAEAAQARGLPSFMAAKMQPWFLSLTLALPPCAMASMAAGEGGVDAQIMEQAAARGIAMAPLEPWEDIFGLLTMGTFEEQIDALRMSLIPPDVQDALIVSLTESYYSGQIALTWLSSTLTADLIPDLPQAEFDEMFAEVEQLMLIDRNRDWIPVIETASQQHSEIFVAFGAAHLIGEEGVLHLLEQNGWTISKYR